jgi:hypothetical protein
MRLDSNTCHFREIDTMKPRKQSDSFLQENTSLNYKARLLVINPLGKTSFFPNAVIQADLDDSIATAEDRKVRLIGHDCAIALPHQ